MMVERRAFTLAQEPTGELYRSILAKALQHCDRFTLVQRRECIIDESAKKVFSELSGHLRQERDVSEWPGTKLLDDTAILREYELSEASVAVLGRVVEGLYEWCQPGRPEDPVFWRVSGGPWLVTIAHESDAYFEMTSAEHEELVRSVPALSAVLEAGE